MLQWDMFVLHLNLCYLGPYAGKELWKQYWMYMFNPGMHNLEVILLDCEY